MILIERTRVVRFLFQVELELVKQRSVKSQAEFRVELKFITVPTRFDSITPLIGIVITFSPIVLTIELFLAIRDRSIILAISFFIPHGR